MHMPIELGASFKGCYSNTVIEGIVPGTQLFKPNISGVILSGG